MRKFHLSSYPLINPIVLQKNYTYRVTKNYTQFYFGSQKSLLRKILIWASFGKTFSVKVCLSCALKTWYPSNTWQVRDCYNVHSISMLTPFFSYHFETFFFHAIAIKSLLKCFKCLIERSIFWLNQTFFDWIFIP